MPPCRTVPDREQRYNWPLMPECRCLTEAVDYRKKCRCRIDFFRHLQPSCLAEFNKSLQLSISVPAEGKALSDHCRGLTRAQCLHPLHRASENDEPHRGIESGTSCTAGEHSMQRAIRTAYLVAIRDLSLCCYTSKVKIKHAAPSLSSR